MFYKLYRPPKNSHINVVELFKSIIRLCGIGLLIRYFRANARDRQTLLNCKSAGCKVEEVCDISVAIVKVTTLSRRPRGLTANSMSIAAEHINE